MSKIVDQSKWECVIDRVCPWCNHSLVDNEHGFDQNDAYIDGDELKHSGHCTYCSQCRR